MKIRTKLLASVLAVALAVLGAMMWFSYTASHRTLETEIKKDARFMLGSYSKAISASLESLDDVARSLAVAVAALDPASEEGVKNLIRGSIDIDPLVYGSTVAFEPNAFPGRAGLFAPYFFREKGTLAEKDLSVPSYDYPAQPWYRLPLETKKGLWSDPYIDVGGGNVAMVTYSSPIVRDGSVRGVATVDVALADLTREVEGIKIARSGFAFLLSRKGTFLTMRTNQWELGRTFADATAEFDSPEIRKMGEEMVAGKTGFTMLRNPLGETDAWFAYGPVGDTGWSLCLVFPEDEMMEEMVLLSQKMAAVAAAGVILLVLLLIFVAGRISRPIETLAGDARRIASGDLSVAPKGLSSRDETGVLSRAFADMAASISRMIGKLKEEKELFSASFTQMSDGLAILAPDFTPVKFNLAAEKLLALPASGSIVEHILGRFECEPPITRIGDFSGGAPAFELTRKASEQAGALFLVMTATPVRDREGEVVNVVLAVRDVTEMKAEEMSKKDFLSTISHKLRTPIAVLQSSVFLIKDGILGALNEKQQKHAATMADQTAKLATLIEELIGFVTLEEEALSRAKEKVDLREMVESISSECGSRMPGKHPKITFEASPGAESLEFNRDYLRLVLCELIQNAVKFNAGESPEVSIRSSRYDGGFLLAVSDNGMGIPPELHGKIFEKFFQAERYFTGNVEGVGLGLSFVKKIVDFADGTIEVRSEPGKGSTFTIRLPS